MTNNGIYYKIGNSSLLLALLCIIALLVSSLVVSLDMTPISFAQSSNNNLTQTSIPTQRSSTLPALNESLIQITAGKVQGLSFAINGGYNAAGMNTNTIISRQRQPLPSITDLSVSLVSQSGSLRILGNTRWNLQSIQSSSGQVLSTKVYASPSLIGSPVFFTVTLQYIQDGQKLKTDSFDLGAIVVGDIKLSVNNLGVRYIGNVPNLVGNILNEGNTPALFTTVEILKGRQQLAAPPSSSSLTSNRNLKLLLLPIASDYLGSVAVNSPMPFNIPFEILQQNTSRNVFNKNYSGNALIKTANLGSNQPSPSNPSSTMANNDTNSNLYALSLRIRYSDDLKNTHEILISKTIDLSLQSGLQPGLVLNGQQGQDNTAIGQTQSVQGQEEQQPSFTNGFVDAFWAANTSVCVSTNSSLSSSSSSTCPSASSSLPIPPQQEVGPGEGQSILAVVLSNTEFSDINGIIGYLTLPPGFSPATSSANSLVNNSFSNKNNDIKGVTNTNFRQNPTALSLQQQVQEQQPKVAITSFNNLVKAGQTYTLYFKVNIDKTTKVGNYLADLRIFYFKVPELQPGQYSSQTFMIPFALPGKVILDTASKTTTLNPGVSNEAKIQIKNKGTAEAHSVIVSVTGISGNTIANNVVINQAGTSNTSNPPGSNSTSGSTTPGGEVTTSSPTSTIATVNLGSRTFDIGILPVNGTAEINPIIYPSNSAGGTLQNLNLQISYTAANGQIKSSIASVGLLVLPTPPEAGISVSPSNTVLSKSTTANSSNNSLHINNKNNNTVGTGTRTNKESSMSGISVTPSSFETTPDTTPCRKSLDSFVTSYPSKKINDIYYTVLSQIIPNVNDNKLTNDDMVPTAAYNNQESHYNLSSMPVLRQKSTATTTNASGGDTEINNRVDV